MSQHAHEVLLLFCLQIEIARGGRKLLGRGENDALALMADSV